VLPLGGAAQLRCVPVGLGDECHCRPNGRSWDTQRRGRLSCESLPSAPALDGGAEEVQAGRGGAMLGQKSFKVAEGVESLGKS